MFKCKYCNEEFENAKKVVDKLQIFHTQVRRFMKKHMLEFFSKCHTRKTCNNN